ncbi:MAG: mobilization protein, partial [Prevotella sp.]
EDTNREHLERNDFILAKQKQEAEQAKAEKIAAQTERDAAVRETDKAKTEQEKLQAGNEEKQRRSAELESEIADKEERARKADRENTDSIKSGIANLLGKGKYAAIEKENQELKQSIPKEKERLNEEFARRLEKELTRRTTEFAEREVGYKRQQEKLRQENGSLAAKYEAALQSRQEADRRTANRLKWCDAVLYRLADALYRAGELFRKIIDAIIDFARSGFGGNGSHGDIFHDDEAARIKEFMNEYAETREEMLAIGNWLVGYSGIKGRLSSQERNRAQKEVDDVAKGRYDWRIERKRNNSFCKA